MPLVTRPTAAAHLPESISTQPVVPTVHSSTQPVIPAAHLQGNPTAQPPHAVTPAAQVVPHQTNGATIPTPPPPSPKFKPSSPVKILGKVRQGTTGTLEEITQKQAVKSAKIGQNLDVKLIDWSKVEGENDNHDWLTYESVYNYVKYQHTKSVLPMGAYQMPMHDLRIIAFEGLTKERFEQLRLAFFPHTKTEDLTKILYRPWTLSPDGKWTSDVERQWAVDAQSTPGYAHMPYNVVANATESQAIGTQNYPAARPDCVHSKGTEPRCQITMLKEQWPMWQTASRSCVIRLDSTEKATPTPTGTPAQGVLDWKFNKDTDTKIPIQTFSGEFRPPAPFNFFSNDQSLAQWGRCYGVKTGVQIVGQTIQSGKETGTGATMGGKGCLEKESIAAAVRSEYLDLLYKIVRRSSPSGGCGASIIIDDIIILPEVLTVTCTNKVLDEGAGDGFQIRDISRLDPKKRYFPPISIPFVGVADPAGAKTGGNPIEFAKPVNLWSFVGKDGPPVLWEKAWTRNFAHDIGYAKAVLHLCYGLQCLTPNSQNFLLEFEPNMKKKYENEEEKRKGSGANVLDADRVVLRDVLDMKLHSDWVLTVMGTPSNELASSVEKYMHESAYCLKSAIASDPATTAAADKFGTNLNKLLTFEATVTSPIDPTNKLIHDSENSHNSYDGNGRLQFFKGTQLNFVNYTALFKGSSVEQDENRPVHWQQVLKLNIDWAFTHAQAYIDTIKRLIFGFPVLNIEVMPLNLSDVGTDQEKKDKKVLRERCVSFLDEYGNPIDVSKQTNPKDQKNFCFSKNSATILLLSDDAAGWKEAYRLHSLFVTWELAVSEMIHQALYGTMKSRQELRNFWWGVKGTLKTT